MKSIAIIIGVSNYHNISDLPGCANDGRLMNQLIVGSKKYNNILYINGNTESKKVKDQLFNFVKEHSGEPLDELFFYFTGHGNFDNNEFYYILSDYNKSQRKQTSLENSELDTIFRTLNPGITVKVVDACHSGVAYIKEEGSFSKYINETQNNFKKCYFMFSSQVDESSYQDKNLSYFTRSFFDALLQHEHAEVRYKEIIDYVSDDFDNKPEQTPFFIVQGDFTEKFISMTEELKQVISVDKSSLDNREQKEESPSLLQLIKENAQEYVTEEEALQTFQTIHDYIDQYPYKDDLIDLYNVTANFEVNYSSLHNPVVVGNWLVANEKADYFAEATYTDKTFLEDIPLTNVWNLPGQTRKVTKTKKVVNGFNLTVENPYRVIRIELEPKLPNIPKFLCMITFIYSKTSIRFFGFSTNYKEIGWNNFSLEKENVAWKTSEAKLKNIPDVKMALEFYLERLYEFAIDFLKNKYGVDEKKTEMA